MKAFLALVLCLCILGASAKQYAVLLAGSNGYSNYRHQADIYHAYQTLLRNGLDPENIIVFAFDDIANNRNNPFPGQVFNAPSARGGWDVYKGVKIDYRGADVTPRKFLAALVGNKRVAGGKVLTSTEEDNVFIYSSGHGGTGLIAFPDHSVLYGNELVEALKYMHERRMYKKLVYYIEACYSGSMFDGLLPPNINIYTTTAANPNEPSYGTYCPGERGQGQDIVNGRQIGSCLGDLYSVNFLEHMDALNLNVETFVDQYFFIKEKTPYSHVMAYGSGDVQQEVVGNFQTDAKKVVKEQAAKPKRDSWSLWNLWAPATNAVDTNSIRLQYLKAKQRRHPSKEAASALNAEMVAEKRLDTIFKKIKEKFALNVHAFVNKVNFECLKKRTEFYTKTCGPLVENSLKYTKFIHQTCIQNVKDDLYEFGIEMICEKYPYVKPQDD